MKKNILVLSANPDKNSFVHSLAEKYAAAAKQAGHDVELVHIPSLAFDHNLMPDQKLEVELKEQQLHILGAEHVVLVTPIWLFSLPAATKAYFERVFAPGFAYSFPHPNPILRPFLPKGLLAGKSVRVITTQDSPRIFSWLIGNPFLFAIPMSTFYYYGMRPMRRTVFARVRKANEQKRDNWAARVSQLGSKAK